MSTLRDAAGVVVRPLAVRDAPASAAAFPDDPDLGRLLGLETDPTEDDILERIDSLAAAALEGRFLELAVETPDVPFAGSLTVLHVNERHRRCEVGYWLVRDARGRGVGRAGRNLDRDVRVDLALFALLREERSRS